MELLLSGEQRLLQDSVSKLLAQHGGVKRTRSLRRKVSGFDREVHAKMAAEGWFSIVVPQEYGGLGLGVTELGLVLMEAGRVLAPEPIAAAIVSAWAVTAASDPSIRDGLLEPIIAGQAIVVPAFSSARTGASVSADGVIARAEGKELVLDGRIEQVCHAAHADGFLIEATSGGLPVLCHVGLGADGLRIEQATTVDGRDYGRLHLSKARARPVIVGAGSAPVIDRMFDLALIMSAAELLGVMTAALDMTVEYLKTRTQFGKPIGSFQALQHRAVDDFTRIVSTRSLLFQVAAQGDAISSAMASALKAHATGEAMKVTKSAIQMHGAIGFTDEHDIGLYLKRAMWLAAYLGNEGHHRKRFAAATGM